MPYKADFVFESENYRGASLAAMNKLAQQKGYRLVGTHRFGFNAFFVKKGIGEQFLPEVEVASCVQDPFSRFVRDQRWPEASAMPWQAV